MDNNNQTTTQTNPGPEIHNKESHRSLHRAAIIGGTVGGVAVLILVALGLGYLRRRSRHYRLNSDGSEIHTEAYPFPTSESPQTILPSKMQEARLHSVVTPGINNFTIDIMDGRGGSSRSRASGAQPHIEDLLVEVEGLRREVRDLRAGEVEPPPTYYTT